jgi:Ca2+-binding EF-hand superfamily protein
MTSRLKAIGLAAALGAAVIVPSLALAGGGHHGPDLQARFTEMDADKDGKVTPAEMAAHRAARFAAADTNGDGKLSLVEIDAARAEMRQGRIARMIWWHDTDGDGMLNASEVPQRGSGKFMKLDRDGDGAVSQEELTAFQERRGKGFFGFFQ